MNKVLARVLLLFFGALLTFLLAQDIRSLIDQISTVYSSLRYEEVEKGIYDSSIFILTCYGLPNFEFISLENVCNCSRRFHDNLDIAKPCRSFTVEYYATIEDRDERKSFHTFFSKRKEKLICVDERRWCYYFQVFFPTES